MKPEELKPLLLSLLSNWEDEVVEFKRDGKGFSTGEIGEYFSALANEANLRCLPRAWLIFGVDNKTHKVIGTDYDASADALNRSGGIKYQITQSADPGVCFSDVHVLDLPEGRVIMFEIPAAPKGIPNVFYEAGIAHTLGRAVIPLARSTSDIPFDLRHHRHLIYLPNEQGIDQMKVELRARITTLLENGGNAARRST